MKTFTHRSIIPATLEQVTAFHDDRRALGWLTPPPIFVRLRHDGRTSLTSGELDFTLWFGPLPIRWKARHEPGPTPDSFIDRMIEGPMAIWVHTHSFKTAPGGVELTDSIQIEHKKSGLISLFTHLAFGGLPLRVLFFYRHLRTRLGAPRMLTAKAKV